MSLVSERVLVRHEESIPTATSVARGRRVIRGLKGAMFAVWRAVRQHQEERAARELLKSLSIRQLFDTGIDLTVAGRGKAIAAEFDPNLQGPR